MAGRVSDPDQLMRTSSGGATSWFARELLRRGLVDGVIQVQARISEIQSRFVFRGAAASGSWSTAAAAAGLTGTSSAGGSYGASGATASC